ncbi:ankyrin repeat-containing domain protein, partial [Bisporella sp. PMI_857]
SCLHFAAFEGNHQMVKFLLHERIMPKDQKNFRDTVLPLAVLRGNLETVKVLLESGMSIDGEILGGENAIHIATVEGNTEMMALLLDHGAKPNSRDRDENTPLHKARSGPVISLLLERGADKNALNYAGEAPIHRLVDRGNRVALEVLLEAGPEINIANEQD